MVSASRRGPFSCGQGSSLMGLASSRFGRWAEQREDQMPLWERLEGGQCRGCVSANLSPHTSLCGTEEGGLGEGDIVTSVSLSLHLTVSLSTCHHISLF